jgi:hypothetical protein
MFPDSWHPCHNMKRRDLDGLARHFTRLQRAPKYYLIDFGISRRYDTKDEPPPEPPIRGGDKSVPEFQNNNSPCNPYQTDIYYIGNFIRQSIMKVSLFLIFCL